MSEEALLPSAAAVRRALVLDIGVQAAGLVALADKRYDPRSVTEEVRRLRDASLISSLERVVPLEEILQATNDDQLNIETLSARLPFVDVMMMMATALQVEAAARSLDAA